MFGSAVGEKIGSVKKGWAAACGRTREHHDDQSLSREHSAPLEQALANLEAGNARTLVARSDDNEHREAATAASENTEKLLSVKGQELVGRLGIEPRTP